MLVYKRHCINATPVDLKFSTTRNSCAWKAFQVLWVLGARCIEKCMDLIKLGDWPSVTTLSRLVERFRPQVRAVSAARVKRSLWRLWDERNALRALVTVYRAWPDHEVLWFFDSKSDSCSASRETMVLRARVSGSEGMTLEWIKCRKREL